jgi:hypothetical protein
MIRRLLAKKCCVFTKKASSAENPPSDKTQMQQWTWTADTMHDFTTPDQHVFSRIISISTSIPVKDVQIAIADQQPSLPVEDVQIENQQPSVSVNNIQILDQATRRKFLNFEFELAVRSFPTIWHIDDSLNASRPL